MVPELSPPTETFEFPASSRCDWAGTWSAWLGQSIDEGQIDDTDADQVNRRLCCGDSVKLHRRHKRTNERRDKRNKRTDGRNRIRCNRALKCDIWWQYFNDFPDNLPTKDRVSIGRCTSFIPPRKKNYAKHRASLPLQDGRPWQTQRTKGQTDRRTDGRVSVRLSLTHWHIRLLNAVSPVAILIYDCMHGLNNNYYCLFITDIGFVHIVNNTHNVKK